MIGRISLAGLVVLLAMLQYKFWFSDVGYLATQRLEQQVLEQKRRTETLRQRNRILTAEVLALQDGFAAVESRARSNLGMIKKGETFYLVSDKRR